MAKKAGLSIRYKILLLMTLLPLIILAVYLFVAVGVFKEDKVAYVFESSSSVAKTLASQTTTDLESSLTNAKPALQEFLSYDRFATISKGLFMADGPIQWISALREREPGDFKEIDVLERNKGTFQIEWRDYPQANQMLRELSEKNRIVLVPFKDERVILGEKIVVPATETTPEKTTLFLIMTRVPNLVQVYQTPGQTENFLLDGKGQVLFGPSGSIATNITERVKLPFLVVSDGQNKQGTEEVLNEKGQALLASYSVTNFGRLFAVSLVPKADALKAVDTLIRKSLIFFAVLICVTVIVSLLASSGLTSALTDLFQATQKVAEGRFDIRVKVTSGDEVGSLADSFNAMATEVSRLMLETAEKARMEGELKTAQTVQETLFPQSQALLHGLRVSGFYEPASECGGDWWHYCDIGGKVYVWIGDATGHGAPAALITSAAKSAATIIETLEVSPGKALELLNRSVFEVSRGRIMMTFFLGCYDPAKKTFTYANASHEAPFLISKADQPPKKKDLIPLNEVNSPRLGQARDTKFEEVTVELKEGDRILLYTDGIPDIHNPESVAWGEREFIKGILSSNKDFPSVDQSVQSLVDQFQSYRKGAPLVDDITFFMIQVEAT
jgi:sigma-B regulation protein RsbU (phosphoserine phosphatase)